MTEDTTPASTPAEHHQEQPAAQQHDQQHEQHYEQPAGTPEHENYDEQFTEGHEDLADILADKPRKLSGAQRAKQQRAYLENEIATRDQRLAELERYIGERDENDRQSQAERQAEAQRKKDDAHLERIAASKSTIRDFDRVLRSMDGVPVCLDVIEEIKASDKSELLTYHLASHPEKIEKLNSMSPTEMAREIGRLEASLKMPEGKKKTTAPPPPTTLRGGAAQQARLEEVSDMREFSKRLLRDLSDRKKR